MVEVIVVVLLLIAAFFGWRRVTTKPASPPVSARNQQAASAYHCVEVRPGPAACQAAKNFGEARYFSSEAPTLPLPACDAAQCTCTFVHYNDRRDELRRNTYGEWASIAPDTTGERRARSERRKSKQSAVKPTMQSAVKPTMGK